MSRAQDSLLVTPAKDSVHITATASDSSHLEKSKKKTFAFILGTDYGKLITTAVGLETKYEFNIGVLLFEKIRLTADYGHGDLSPKNAIENGNYTSSGNYYRGGIDYVFEIAPKTYLGIGAMYASSSFKDEGEVLINSDIWPSLTDSFVRPNFNAQWVEWVLTSEKVIANRESGFLSNLYIGMKFRLRFMINRPEPEKFDIYAIPGYGRTFNNIVPAANLFIAYKIK